MRKFAGTVSPLSMPCTHGTVEQVINGNNDVIGGQCATCLEVLWGIGTCAGCGKAKARLTYVLDEQRRYCTDECRKGELKRIREAAASSGTR